MAGAIYIGGAIGMEMLGGYFVEVYGQKSFVYFLISTIEEFLEMFGIAVFIYALLSYITNHIDVANWQICFNRGKNFQKSLEN